MAGLPGGGRGPGGVPKFVSAPATQPVGDSTTYIARGATVTPSWGAWRGWNAFADWIQQGIRTAAVVQAPFSQDDWPNPRGPINPSYQKFTDYSSGLDLELVVTPPDTTHIIRTPTVTPTWQKWQARNYVNWADFYSIQILPPPTNYDWPNPRPPPRSIELLTWKQSPKPQAVVVQAPFGQDDWPNPRAPRRSINLLTWVNGVVGAAPVVSGTPVTPFDWPNPRGWPRPHVGFVAGETLKQPPPPTRTSDCLLLFEDSSGNLILEDFLGLLALELCGPFVTYDLSLPPRALGPRQDWLQNAYAARNTAIVPRGPFVQTDWPNPRAPRPSINLLTWARGVLGSTPVVVGQPFAQTDWPNPLRSTDRGQYQKWADWISVQILPPPTNYDQPNPRAPQFNRADWIQSAFLALSTTPVAPKPFAQTSWPNPFGRLPAHVGFTSATSLLLLRPDVNPFIPRDFANPKAPQRGVDLYGWIQALTALVIPPPPPPVFPPIAQYDWPNPAGPQRGIDLWGWSQPVTALNLPPTPEPPPVVLQPGGRGVPHTFSRKKWRELQMLIAAEMAAVAKAEEVTKRGKREALLQAARAAAAAVDAAEAEGENKRLDKLLVRNALTLRAAIRAASEVKLLRETASAIEQSRAIVQRQQDEEDEMINLLMLS